MPQTLRSVSLGDRSVLLLGTAHISPDSVREVRATIAVERPAVVCVEIDAGRYRSMSEGSSWERLDIGKVLKEGRGFLLMSNLALAGFQRRMGEGVGVRPGEDMLAAADAAKVLGIPAIFCDREVQTTLKRAWARSGLWNRSKLIASLASSAFSNEKLTGAEIERLKERNELEEMMGELADYLPSVKEVLIDERDRYLAAKIYEAAMAAVLPAAHTATTVATTASPAPAENTVPPAAVAVVGAGHLSGIEAWLGRFARGEATTETAALEIVPPPSFWAKAAAWLIPGLLVLLVGLGFLKAGAAASLELILRWILLNGTLSAIGSALCLAHPLTIALSFVAAPLATLNPFVSVGLFAGLAEAFLRKPRVVDLERLAEDATSLRGFYRNRVTHILLVFFVSSLGGMIGNFIALPLLASKALGG